MDSYVYMRRGLLYEQLGSYYLAIADYNQAIPLDSTNPAPFARLIFVYATIDDYQNCELAVTYLGDFITMYPDSLEAAMLQFVVDRECSSD
jgi:tetratricopeptide (TPR) repeat protein